MFDGGRVKVICEESRKVVPKRKKELKLVKITKELLW
jgi:hypothetical protein